MKNILEYLEHTAENHPDKIGFTDEQRDVTFSELMQNAQRIAGSLARIGCRKPVAVLIDRNVRCIEAMFGSGLCRQLLCCDRRPFPRDADPLHIRNPASRCHHNRQRVAASGKKTGRSILCRNDHIIRRRCAPGDQPGSPDAYPRANDRYRSALRAVHQRIVRDAKRHSSLPPERHQLYNLGQ